MFYREFTKNLMFYREFTKIQYFIENLETFELYKIFEKSMFLENVLKFDGYREFMKIRCFIENLQ